MRSLERSFIFEFILFFFYSIQAQKYRHALNLLYQNKKTMFVFPNYHYCKNLSKKMLQYFELLDGTSSKFWEVSLNANTLTTRYGKIGTAGKATQKDFDDPVKAQKEYDKLVKEKTGKGYKAVVKDSKTLRPADYTIITEKEACARFNLDKYIDGLYDDGGNYMLYEGDVTFDGVLDMHKHCAAAENDIYGIIVQGNLTVNGVIYQPDMDHGQTLLVTGNLHAKSINKGGAEFYIKGNVTVEQTIYGYYNHGKLTVEGDTQAVAIFPDDHYFKFGGSVSGTVISERAIEGIEADYSKISVLRPELIRDGAYGDSNKINEYINQGKHILRDERLPGAKKIPTVSAEAQNIPSAKPEILTGEEAKERVDMSAYDPIGDIYFERAIYFDGDVFVNGDLDPEWAKAILIADEEEEHVTDLLIVVNGNLTVAGDVAPGEGMSPCLLVLGNLTCDVLYSADEFIHVTGDATIKYAFDGNYNDGSITIDGTTHVPYVLNSDHDASITTNGAVLINYFGDANDFFDYDYTEKDFERVMVSAVFKEQQFSQHAFIDLLKAGKSPLKKGVQPARLLVMQELEQLSVATEKIEVLDLRNKALDKFPALLTTLAALKKLVLDGNALTTLPDEIAALESLEELYLSDCSLQSLPDALATLKNLTVLDVSKNSGLQLPESLAQLTSLRVLDISKNIGFGLSAGIAGLEELRCNDCTEDAPVDFPAAILQCTGLKRLVMNNNSVKSIPADLTALKGLEDLYLNASLCYVNEFPDLSGLSSLKVLHADGIYNFDTSPLVKQSLLQSFFKITSLEELKIDGYRRWLEDLSADTFKKIAENLAYDPGRLQELSDLQAKKVDFGNGKMVGQLREPLTAAHLEGIGALQQLEVLDLSRNMLADVPAELSHLKNLRALNLKGNCFVITERLKIAGMFPDIDVDFRDNWVAYDPVDTAEAKAWKEMNDLLEEGNKLWFNLAGQNIAAIKKYEEALAYFREGKVNDRFKLLHINYLKTNACSNISRDKGYDALSADERRQYRLDCIEQGLKTLDLLPAEVMSDTSMGKFYNEVICVAANSVAWAMYETYEDKAEMEKALVVVERAVAAVQSKSEYYVYDTQVRLLLRLGRKEEAWKIVQRTLDLDWNYAHFKDLVGSKEYKAWLKKQ
jgi:Leucine-rich repeat (LRR) protein/predicted DNA-binding WGR domain protein